MRIFQILFITAVAFILVSCKNNNDSSRLSSYSSDRWKELPSSGIPDCDAYLRYVCSCSNRYPKIKDLRYGCNLARNMVKDWKTRENPVREVIIQSCIKAGEALEDSGQCGPFVR